MFFPNLIDVKRKDKVLDIGCGPYPYRRADVLCDKYGIENEHDCIAQCGAPVRAYNKPFYKIENNTLPFGDKEFDLATCACVIEHIPIAEIPRFICEIERVSKKQYIEIPKPFYDSVYNLDVHLNLCDIAYGEIILLDKRKTSLKTVSHFNRWATELRARDIFSVDNHPTVTAVGKMFYGNIPHYICKTEAEFWDIVSKNTYFCEPPSLVWKIWNRIIR